MKTALENTTVQEMKARICEVYPDLVKDLDLSDIFTVLRWFEMTLRLDDLSNISYRTDKRITERNIKRIKQCKTKQEVRELLSTGNKKTVSMILNKLGIRGCSFKNCVEQLINR